jgi:hypothetical protein
VTGALGAEEIAHQTARNCPRWSLKPHQTVQHSYLDLNYAGSKRKFVHASTLSSNADACICLETGTNSHLNVEDNNKNVSYTKQPRQRARHGASNDGHVYGWLDNSDDILCLFVINLNGYVI